MFFSFNVKSELLFSGWGRFLFQLDIGEGKETHRWAGPQSNCTIQWVRGQELGQRDTELTECSFFLLHFFSRNGCSFFVSLPLSLSVRDSRSFGALEQLLWDSSIFGRSGAVFQRAVT